MVGKKRGRKPLNRTQDFKRGYNAGWGRAMRKASGQIPTTRKINDKQRSKDWQEGLKSGLAAGKFFFGTKRNRS